MCEGEGGKEVVLVGGEKKGGGVWEGEGKGGGGVCGRGKGGRGEVVCVRGGRGKEGRCTFSLSALFSSASLPCHSAE